MAKFHYTGPTGPARTRTDSVKLLSKRWWIPIGARLEAPTAEVGFPTADQGLSSIQDTLFGLWHLNSV